MPPNTLPEHVSLNRLPSTRRQLANKVEAKFFLAQGADIMTEDSY